MINKGGSRQLDRRDVTREYRRTLRFITSFPKFPIVTEKGPGGRGLWLYFVYWGCASLKGMFFTVSLWEGCCFQAQ